MTSLSFPAVLPASWQLQIQSGYSEPQRSYHTLLHIENMMSLLTTYREQVANPEAVELAILFHDLVYDPIRKDNEKLSAERFEHFAAEVGLDEELSAKVHRMIMATEKHQLDELGKDDFDLKFFLDIDLEVLSWDQPEYLAYSKQIRQEYSHVPEDQFRKGRAVVLRNFLKREVLYFTDGFRERGESKARANMEAEIRLLESSEAL